MRLMRVQAFQPLSVESIARQVAMSPSISRIGFAWSLE
jgi:hypothetical protein